jgi:Kdo2-lipid IVA lauroyltransferase/acyltransferase
MELDFATIPVRGRAGQIFQDCGRTTRTLYSAARPHCGGRGESIVSALFFRFLALFPLPALYPWGWCAYILGFHVLRWRRDQVEHDIAVSLPNLSPAQRAEVVRQSYRRVGDLLMEMIWGFGASGQALMRRVAFENPEVVERYEAEARSVVLLTPHYCNWEWLYLAGGARFGLPIDTVYQPHRLKSLDRYLVASRSRFGGRPIPRKEFVYELLKTAGSPRGYSLIADQMPKRNERKHWTRFLGRDTAFYIGADQIARFLDAPVVYVAMRRVRRGYYSVRFDILAEPPYETVGHDEIMERFARRTEQACLESPADFLWLQKRWKYPRPANE